MEGEEIGLVLARASDLRARMSACAAAARPEDADKRLGAAGDGEEGEEEDAEEQVVESLVGISDALESLERQLAALQVCRLTHHTPFCTAIGGCLYGMVTRGVIR